MKEQTFGMTDSIDSQIIYKMMKLIDAHCSTGRAAGICHHLYASLFQWADFGMLSLGERTYLLGIFPLDIFPTSGQVVSSFAKSLNLVQVGK